MLQQRRLLRCKFLVDVVSISLFYLIPIFIDYFVSLDLCLLHYAGRDSYSINGGIRDQSPRVADTRDSSERLSDSINLYTTIPPLKPDAPSSNKISNENGTNHRDSGSKTEQNHDSSDTEWNHDSSDIERKRDCSKTEPNRDSTQTLVRSASNESLEQTLKDL